MKFNTEIDQNKGLRVIVFLGYHGLLVPFSSHYNELNATTIAVLTNATRGPRWRLLVGRRWQPAAIAAMAIHQGHLYKSYGQMGSISHVWEGEKGFSSYLPEQNLWTDCFPCRNSPVAGKSFLPATLFLAPPPLQSFSFSLYHTQFQALLHTTTSMSELRKTAVAARVVGRWFLLLCTSRQPSMAIYLPRFPLQSHSWTTIWANVVRWSLPCGGISKKKSGGEKGFKNDRNMLQYLGNFKPTLLIF